MFGICSSGIMELGMDSSIWTGVPFHAQSSMNSRTMFGFSAAAHVPARNHPSIKSTVILAEKGPKLRKMFEYCILNRIEDIQDRNRLQDTQFQFENIFTPLSNLQTNQNLLLITIMQSRSIESS